MKRLIAVALGGLALAASAGSALAQYPYPYPAYPAYQAGYYPQPAGYPPVQYVSYAPQAGMPGAVPMMVVPQPMVQPVYVPMVRTQYVPVFGPLETMPAGGPLNAPAGGGMASTTMASSSVVTTTSAKPVPPPPPANPGVGNPDDPEFVGPHQDKPSVAKKVHVFLFGPRN